jgi:hypothetical protein
MWNFNGIIEDAEEGRRGREEEGKRGGGEERKRGRGEEGRIRKC